MIRTVSSGIALCSHSKDMRHPLLMRPERKMQCDGCIIEASYLHLIVVLTRELAVGDIQQRVSRIESDRNHLATKEDLAQLETRLVKTLSDQTKWMASELAKQTKWMVGLMIATIIAVAAVSTAIQSLIN